MTASLHPFRPLSAPVTVSARLDAQTKKKCGWLDRVFQSAAGLTAVALLGVCTSIQRIFFYYCFCIIVRGRFRLGIGVDVNKTQSNR